jgi:dihydrofolate synthase / folylpolyglutamate synthase
MSYTDSVAKLYALGHELHSTPVHKFDLAHMRTLLAAMGQPQQRFRSVLIAGTNGKGSTAATLASILVAAGHRTALYTSPHLVRPNERIRVNRRDISDEDFARAHADVERIATELVARGDLPHPPSFFETITAMAFRYFAESHVEIAVLEVGMGGRLDATNVVEPLVSVITDISLDHQKYLGNTIAEIAREKAGIIHEGGLVVTLPQHPQANDAIGHAVLERNARGVSAAPYVPPVSPNAPSTGDALRNRYPLEVMGQQITVDSPLPGRHQLRNLALAITAAEQLNQLGISVNPADMERGIRATRWPGRFQVIPAHDRKQTPETAPWPDIVLDVAHNPDGAWALRSALSERFPDRPLTFVFGVMRDKAMDEIAQILFFNAEHVIATHAGDNPRAATPEEVAATAQRVTSSVQTAPTVLEALALAHKLTQSQGVIVVTGSIYIVGEAIRAFEAVAT